MDLKDKVCIVTGAGSGIGKAVALKFMRSGANVVLVGRRKSKLDEVIKGLETYKKNVITIECDVSKARDVEEMADKTKC